MIDDISSRDRVFRAHTDGGNAADLVDTTIDSELLAEEHQPLACCGRCRGAVSVRPRTNAEALSELRVLDETMAAC